MWIFYKAATLTMKVLLVALTRWRVEGRTNVPRTGPLIVAANHHSLIDPPLLGASIPRRISFMAKEELFDRPLPRFVMESYGAFPVRRGRLDRVAFRQAMKALEDGGALGVFPEGKRSPDGQLQRPQPGASLLAARSGAPILPVAIFGSERVKGLSFILHRPKVNVKIGSSFLLSPSGSRLTRSMLAQHSEVIMEHIAELLPESYRGPYATDGGSGDSDGD
jgi:1-acyl-sn-glycerol-3-phosphate acyltransferase